jgi:hypothetical protein
MMDEGIFDEADEVEEIQILDPPLPPTLTDAIPEQNLSTPSEKQKVNEINMSSDPTEGASSNYASSRTGESVITAETGETFRTSYSKYGIKENGQTGYSQSNTANMKDFDEETGKPILGSAYQQCKSARAASLFQHAVTSVDISDESGKSETTSIFPIGSLNCTGDTEVLRTFRGTRMSSNNITVNQNISFSYDPATLLCVICEKPHSILATGEGGAPPILIFCDQNFLPTLSKGSSCVAISRLEDATLDELVELAKEVVDRHHIPVGSLLLGEPPTQRRQ